MAGELARCPDDNVLGRLIAGELGGDDRAAVERHLGGCVGCAQLIAAYARTTPPRAVPERFVVIRRLGAGGMGEVWEADDLVLGRRVALKFVRPEQSGDGAHRARLVREARALARLRHPNVVAVYDLEQAADEMFLALELVEGVTARAWRDAAKRSMREVVELWLQVADGLAAVHRAGVVHRDLKPDNVLVADDGRVVIGDFGLASVAAGVGSTTLTATGQVIGTPLYMPLEQLRGDGATEKSDQFALCVCMWEAIVGERPFSGATLPALMRAMEETPRVGRLQKGRSVLKVLARGMEKEAKRRWDGVEEMAEAVRRSI